MGQVTARLTERDPRLLVGFDTADDAGVVAFAEDRALVQTIDFFTPIVDDPFTFGAIAAANALSDVYAMGGEPLSALNVVCFPDKDLPVDVLAEILAGGLAKVHEAGAVLAGGHSVRDAELKYGLAVTGLVDPRRVWRNSGARPGDVLVLTKPIGTGILATALKRERIDAAAMAPAVDSMLRLHRDVKRAAEALEVHAATDVTGFGLAGHAWEMARASGVRIRFRLGALPLFPGVLELAEERCVPGGTGTNRAWLEGEVSAGHHAIAARGLSEAELAVVLDPQTSGGLLFALPAEQAHRLDAHGGVVVGDVSAGPAGIVVER